MIKNTPVVLAVCQEGLRFGFSFSLPQTGAQPETVAAWKNLQIKNRQITADREIFNPILNSRTEADTSQRFPNVSPEICDRFYDETYHWRISSLFPLLRWRNFFWFKSHLMWVCYIV